MDEDEELPERQPGDMSAWHGRGLWREWDLTVGPPGRLKPMGGLDLRDNIPAELRIRLGGNSM